MNTIEIVRVSRRSADSAGLVVTKSRSGLLPTSSGSLETCAFGTLAGKSVFELDVLSVCPSEVSQALPENSKVSLPDFVRFSETHQYADEAWAITLLCKYSERPRCRGTAKNSDKLAPPHVAPEAWTIDRNNSHGYPKGGVGRSRNLCFGSIVEHAARQDRYSITSSAISKKSRVIVRPSVLAVFKLMTNSNLVGCCTGNSAGSAPFRIFCA